MRYVIQLIRWLLRFNDKASEDRVDAYSAQSAFFIIMGFIPFVMLLLILLQYTPMKKEDVMGNGAIALGALSAGVNLVTGYPGTPSSEILENIQKYSDGSVHIEWSVNEKSAMEVAASASYSGARTLVTMKQVGLNVASDPLMSLAYVGVKGGMVIVSADDPGPISSQTEQDTRMFAEFCRIPVFDPASPEKPFR